MREISMLRIPDSAAVYAVLSCNCSLCERACWYCKMSSMEESGAYFIKELQLQIANCNLQFHFHWSFPWKRARGLAAAKDFARVSMEPTNEIETASCNLQFAICKCFMK